MMMVTMKTALSVLLNVKLVLILFLVLNAMVTAFNYLIAYAPPAPLVPTKIQFIVQNAIKNVSIAYFHLIK